MLLQEARSKISEPVQLILIGGAAVFLCGSANRVTEDIDILASPDEIEAFKRAGILKPPIQVVADSFLCLHPDYRRACIYVRELSFPPKIKVYRLSPLDLAISKLSRFQQVDVDDIRAIVERWQITRKRFVQRYATARAYYTNPRNTDFNVSLLIREVYGEEFDPKKDLPRAKGPA